MPSNQQTAETTLKALEEKIEFKRKQVMEKLADFTNRGARDGYGTQLHEFRSEWDALKELERARWVIMELFGESPGLCNAVQSSSVGYVGGVGRDAGTPPTTDEKRLISALEEKEAATQKSEAASKAKAKSKDESK